MTEEQKERVARFFYFAVSDSALAYASSTRVMTQLIKARRAHKEKQQHFSFETELVRYSNKAILWTQQKKNKKPFWKTFFKKFSTEKSSSKEMIWSIPPDLDISIWRKFRKESTQEEFLAVIWSQILHIPDQNIAEALRLSTGTVRSRVGNGLRSLGRRGHA